MLVDSHCHLDYLAAEEDLDAVVARAREAGVGTMLTISTRLSRFAEVAAIAERYPDVWCSVGVHPHEAGEEGQAGPERLLELARHPRVVGIGESGLDYFYDNAPREAQRRSFRAHARAARESGLPLIVHARDADDDVAAILRAAHEEGAYRCVMHCFSSGRRLAEAALELGFAISFSGIVTFKKAGELRAIARDVPPDRLLVETDAPYLAPVPKRGRRNEPAYVAHTAAMLAEVKGVSPEELARVTTDNFFGLFAKAERPAAG
jgi:TatD DNase family protein